MLGSNRDQNIACADVHVSSKEVLQVIQSSFRILFELIIHN
jgi:hypothetical protein